MSTYDSPQSALVTAARVLDGVWVEWIMPPAGRAVIDVGGPLGYIPGQGAYNVNLVVDAAAEDLRRRGTTEAQFGEMRIALGAYVSEHAADYVWHLASAAGRRANFRAYAAGLWSVAAAQQAQVRPNGYLALHGPPPGINALVRVPEQRFEARQGVLGPWLRLLEHPSRVTAAVEVLEDLGARALHTGALSEEGEPLQDASPDAVAVLAALARAEAARLGPSWLGMTHAGLRWLAATHRGDAPAATLRGQIRRMTAAAYALDAAAAEAGETASVPSRPHTPSPGDGEPLPPPPAAPPPETGGGTPIEPVASTSSTALIYAALGLSALALLRR